MMKRIVSVWLIDWPVTVWANAAGRASPPEAGRDREGSHGGAPFALVARTARGAILHALNASARAAGLSRGQTQADALAMLPGLICRPADLAADRRALQALAVWAERWSPAVSVDAPGEAGGEAGAAGSPHGLEGLFFDLTGATHLFGGEATLLERIEHRLAQAGARSRAAIAETPGAAWALCRWGPSRSGTGRSETGQREMGGHPQIIAPGQVRERLAGLPVEALRLDAATLKQAHRFGLKRIGDLYPMPRAGLARRFQATDGAGLVRRLDQALGATAEALTPTRPPPRYRTWQAYAEPVGDTAGVEGRLPGLAEDLSAALERDGQGARALTLTGFRTDGATTALSIRLGLPGRDAAIWMRLFREKGIERLDLGFGVDALMLTCDLAEPIAAHQVSIETETATRHAESLAGLIDRLSARLGEQAVQVAEPQGSWLPERSERWRPALGARPVSAQAHQTPRSRPILMLDPPEPIDAIAELPDGAPARFTWRRVSRKVARADGPERLSPEWWRPPSEGRGPLGRQPRTRDYYRVEDDQGLRYWLFREGLYGAEYAGGVDERAPSWWMHGMFP
ncbi:Y-family DNA polymerase [Brevundimonas sp.]|uniref:Y-family DNA polymerase n=1 Tax=Brevundimonas sp. TaxID=1871086 RepID=UPI003BAAC87D